MVNSVADSSFLPWFCALDTADGASFICCGAYACAFRLICLARPRNGMVQLYVLARLMRPTLMYRIFAASAELTVLPNSGHGDQQEEVCLVHADRPQHFPAT